MPICVITFFLSVTLCHQATKNRKANVYNIGISGDKSDIQRVDTCRKCMFPEITTININITNSILEFSSGFLVPWRQVWPQKPHLAAG